ncbi:MAG: hypothetical protein R2753_02065 [Chitinophagales bacterium]
MSVFILLFIVADSIYSFQQYYQLPLDGDIAPIVAPSNHYSSVLKDPFGISVIKDHNEYAATNRYFSHITMIGYFKNFHLLLSSIFKDKIKALYVSMALFNTAIQLLLLIVLAVYVCGHIRFWKASFLMAAAILIPFFQVNGFYESIGIIDKSVTYTFFYALPMGLLLIYFLPFYLSFYHQKPIENYFKKWMWPFWLILAVYLSFSGSQIAPLVILICPTVVLVHLYFVSKKAIDNALSKNIFNGFQRISKTLLIFFGVIFLLSLYSFYIGKFNIENGEGIALSERYIKLAKGLPKFLTYKITFVLIALVLSINLIFIKRLNPNFLSEKKFKAIVIALLLCIAYLILLPLGGYRPYRPWIVRYDTFLPITIVLILLLSISSYYLLKSKSFPKKIKFYYATFLITILMVFQFNDSLTSKYGNNKCQKAALYKIAASDENVIELSSDCTILSWSIMGDPLYSKDIGKMLHYWGISRKEITFYQISQ